MANLEKIWEFQVAISSAHVYVMGIKSLVAAYYLLRYRSIYFNINKIETHPYFFLVLGIAIMPIYYVLESYTTMSLCQVFIHYTCKFIIHHILTISLLITLFQYSFYNSFTLLIIFAHGMMNIGYYYSPSLQYIMCRWYFALTIINFLFFIRTAFFIAKHRTGAIQISIIGFALGVNNLCTPELLSMCKINDKVELFTNEFIIHMLGIVFYLAVLRKYSKKTKEKINI